MARLVRDAFEGFAGGDGHPCLGARSVVRRQAYELRLYEELGTAAAASRLNEDLGRFGATVRAGELTSFVAVFAEPTALNEAAVQRPPVAAAAAHARPRQRSPRLGPAGQRGPW